MARDRGGLIALALVLPLALALGGCELGLHEYQQATVDDCEPWRTGCPAVLDFTQARPINASRVDIDRVAIVADAAAAPHRQCDTVTPVCQGRIVGDALWDQYIMVLAGEPNASATAASSQPSAAGAIDPTAAGAIDPTAAGAIDPTAAGDPAGPQAAPSGRIVRTQGVRPGEAAQPVPSSLPR